MATSFKKTEIRPYPRIGEKVTRDTIYWKSLEPPVTCKEFGAIGSIHFCPVKPYHFAVTSSTRVLLYNSRTNRADKKISKFHETAHSGKFRSDAKLIVAGDDEGIVRLFDTETRSLLRTMKGHTGPVHYTDFTTDKLHVVSGSNDTKVKLWDIATESEIVSYKEHTDYIRTGAVSRASNDIILSGSYDHTVKLYDTRTTDSIMTIDHGHPVEDVLTFPGGGMFLSAGGNVIKVWNALAGGRLVASFSNHHKTITSLCFCSNHQRLMSGSLDRHVKIYDVTTYQVVHTLDYSDPILSIGISPDDEVLAVGMANGLLSIQHRKSEDGLPQKKKRVTYSALLHGKVYKPSQDDIIIEHKRKEQLAKYDKYMKKFDHTRALDSALNIKVRHRNPEVTISVLQELILRGAIKQALAGRDEKTLFILLKFIQRHISNPRFTSTLIDITNLITEVNKSSFGLSGDLDAMLKNITETINREEVYIKEMHEVLGLMDTLFAVAHSAQTSVMSQPQPVMSQAQRKSDELLTQSKTAMELFGE